MSQEPARGEPLDGRIVPQNRQPLRVALGLGAALAFSAIVLVPLALKKSSETLAPGPPASSLASGAAKDAEVHAQALSAATSLASTLSALSQMKTARSGVAQPQRPPPAASSFPSEAACLASYLPALAPVDPEDLTFICKNSELWAIERRAHTLMTGKPGPAAQLWKRFGSRSLSVLATMRAGCCPDAEPLSAVVPGLWCGVLRDKVRLFTALPERTTVADLEQTLACLSRRGARLPPHWATVPEGRSERAFDEFMVIARGRH